MVCQERHCSDFGNLLIPKRMHFSVSMEMYAPNQLTVCQETKSTEYELDSLLQDGTVTKQANKPTNLQTSK